MRCRRAWLPPLAALKKTREAKSVGTLPIHGENRAGREAEQRVATKKQQSQDQTTTFFFE